MQKILIVYATAGEGHKRAAVAIKNAFDILKPSDTEIKLIDALDYTNNFFKWFYPRSYIFMVTHIPTIWGFFYYLSDIKWLNPLVRFVRRLANKKNTGALEEFFCSYRPDKVITTHFLASEVISNLKRQGKIATQLITCITDFGMHSFWFAKETDFFCVSFEETKKGLIKKWRFPAEKIIITGIPTHPKFYEVKNKDEIRSRLNLSKDLFTILITGGGFGVGPILGLVRALKELDIKLQILVVCGHNDKLRQQIETQYAIRSAERSGASPKGDTQYAAKIIPYGFIDYVDELMSVSDIGVTKAGGLICSEAIAKELPLVIIAPIPGQESRNCRLMLINEAAFKINKPRQIKKIIKKVCCDNSILNEMKINIKKIRRPDSAITIAQFALKDAR